MPATLALIARARRGDDPTSRCLVTVADGLAASIRREVPDLEPAAVGRVMIATAAATQALQYHGDDLTVLVNVTAIAGEGLVSDALHHRNDEAAAVYPERGPRRGYCMRCGARQPRRRRWSVCCSGCRAECEYCAARRRWWSRWSALCCRCRRYAADAGIYLQNGSPPYGRDSRRGPWE